MEPQNQNNDCAEDNNDRDSDEDESMINTMEEMNAKYGEWSHNCNLRERKWRDYSHLFANAKQRTYEMTKSNETAGSFGESSDPDTMLETLQMNMQ